MPFVGSSKMPFTIAHDEAVLAGVPRELVNENAEYLIGAAADVRLFSIRETRPQP